MNEEKLKKWLQSNVIYTNIYGTGWEKIMQKELDEVFEKQEEN